MSREEIEAKRAEAMAKGSAAAPPGQQARPAMPNQSRLTLARAGIRPAMKGRVMLSGPAGGGKTYTALVIATTLVGPQGKILVVDSEKESALTYADVFTFDHLRWNPPFDPTALSLTLKEAQLEFDAVIVDSFSHWWRKQGGVLDIAGDNIRGWKSARPIQEDLIETILDVDCHVIVCCRSKMEHLIQQEGGKTTVTKVGIKAQQDDDLEYEVNVALEIDMQHVLHIAKSRTNAVPVGTQYLAGLAGNFAQEYRDWLRSGEAVAPKEATDALRVELDKIADPGDRTRAKMQFLDSFGRPEFLLVSRLGEARQWVADVIAGRLAIERAEDDVPPDDDPEGAPGAAQASSEQSAPPAAAEPQAGTQEPQGEASAQSAPVDDVGYCAGCGAPIYRDDVGLWNHVEGDDAAACLMAGGPAEATPAEPGVDVDALYAKVHAPKAAPAPPDAATTEAIKAREKVVREEVKALTQTRLVAELNAANLGTGGNPRTQRERLIVHRLTH